MSFRRKRFDRGELIAAWEACESISDVAQRLGITPHVAYARAGLLRLEGIELRRLAWNRTSTAPSSGSRVIDYPIVPESMRDEVRELVEAYRAHVRRDR